MLLQIILNAHADHQQRHEALERLEGQLGYCLDEVHTRLSSGKLRGFIAQLPMERMLGDGVQA